MSKLLPFPAAKARRPSKFGYERVRKRDRKDRGQLDLFAGGSSKLIEFPAAGRPGPFEEALALEDGGDEAAARRLYEKAVAEGDSVPDACCNLGVIESKAGGVEQAFDCFRNALKQDQQHWESHYNLANLYFDTGEYRPARVHYELAAEIEPEFRNIYFNLGLVLAIDEEFELAIDALSRYRKLAPDSEAGAAEDLLEHLRRSLEQQG